MLTKVGYSRHHPQVYREILLLGHILSEARVRVDWRRSQEHPLGDSDHNCLDRGTLHLYRHTPHPLDASGSYIVWNLDVVLLGGAPG